MGGRKPLSNIDVIVLAGGLGTRIRDVIGGIPKILAPINGIPFLDHLLRHLAAMGGRHVIISLGHLAGKVVDYLAANQQPEPNVRTVIELEPMGTAGGVRLSGAKAEQFPLLVMNGDTWCDADLNAFANDYQASGAEISMLCVEVEDVSRYGRVERTPDGMIAEFVEKDSENHSPGLINGGIYLISKSAFTALQSSKGKSLELDFLERQPAGTIQCYVARGAQFVDIGTPSSLASASDIITGNTSESRASTK
jgi:NDP-sugar pyrophosphorylase family protein